MSDKEPSGYKAEKIFTDEISLGKIDSKKIPNGYGIVALDPNASEILVTNEIGDVLLFINPKTRHLSSMELKDSGPNPQISFSGLDTLPPEYAEALNNLNIPEFQITKSHEGTEFVHGIGVGDSKAKPIEVVQRTTQTYKDISLVHLASIKSAVIKNKPLYVSLNQILFSYIPNSTEVEIKAEVKFSGPRSFEEVEKTVKAKENISFVDLEYYTYLINNPDIFKTPEQWYRQDYAFYGLKNAKAMFAKVQERIRKKDL